MTERSCAVLTSSSFDPKSSEQAAALIAQSDASVIAAGAGIGVDPALPDFRGNGGFWRAYPTLAASGTTFRDIASPAAFTSDPRLAWRFYGHRLDLFRRREPHAGFELLRRWGQAKQYGSFVFTSKLQCATPCCQTIWPVTFDPVVDVASCTLVGSPPSCPDCGCIARPNVLTFDWNRISARRDPQAIRCLAWLDHVRRPVMIEIGASLRLRTVRYFSERVVRQHNGVIIRINPREPQIGGLSGVALASNALST